SAALVAVLVAGFGLIAACTPPNLPPPVAPSGASSVPSTPPGAGTVVVGMDGSSGPISGFNPHAIADFSQAAQAVASLVLPSVFVVQPDGSSIPDPDVVDSAQVTSQNPFTVTYTLDRKASWSDGTPITAEDFSYLRDQLVAQPATVDPAGYRLITQIRSRDAGKTVEVEFAAEFADWPALFSPLLPSHIMKDFPGGWGAALNADIPVSGNRYKMNSYDPVTGQVLLARNDKYWATPPGPAAVVLRLGDPTDLIAAFSRGDVQALWLEPDADTVASVEESIPAERRTTVPLPATTQLIFNTTTGPTSSADLRAAIAAGISQALVRTDLSGGWVDGAVAVSSQVRLPAQGAEPDPATSAAAVTADAITAQESLTAAGYLRNGLYATRNGEVLRLTLGFPTGNPRVSAAARTIQRQLGSIGIEVDLLADNAPSLLETRVAAGTLDLALVAVPRGSKDAAAAASAFGCPRPGTATGGDPDDPLVPATAPSTPATTTTSTPSATQTAGSAPATAADAAATAPLRTGNLSGYCTAATQKILVDAITGQSGVDAADPGLWANLPVLPLAELSTVFAVSPGLSSVLDGPHEGWLWTGPLAGLAAWPVG
ncbi:MAG TPA: ABC transporter family substrate-binding protein, partial [Nakamurella sp.]